MNELTIHRDDTGQRLDRFLRKLLPNMPLSAIYRCIRKRQIRVNGKRMRPEYMLQSSDRLTFFLPKAELAKEQQTHLADLKHTRFFQNNFCIVHEDASLLVLNKPAGVVVHPGTKYKRGQTLIDLVNSYLGAPTAKAFQPSLLHRLDKDTSGLILVAKTGQALRSMTQQFREGQIQKEYVALVTGRLGKSKGVWRQKLVRAKDSERGGKVRVVNPDHETAQEAVTHFRKLKEYKGYTLVAVMLETGRTHQIRVHFASQNHPLAGDRDYNSQSNNRHIQKRTGLKRQFLHARQLNFAHPQTGKPMTLQAPLPHDLKQCLAALETLSKSSS